jgi:2-iminoacetate synthase
VRGLKPTQTPTEINPMSTNLISQSGASFLDEAAIQRALEAAPKTDPARVRAVLEKAGGLTGLDAVEVAVLMGIEEPALLEELYAAARRVKQEIYGSRLVLFAPLYISNLCHNECLYCAFRVKNTALKRRALTQSEIAAEVRVLINQGHKRVLLVAGESYPAEGFRYVLRAIETIYQTKEGRGEIRRVNVNIAPLTVEQFRELKDARIGTYQLFQETYHRPTYARVHTGGKKRDFEWRVNAMDRAMEAGIDDVGVGVLFGLGSWKFELLALMQHIHHLETTFGVGPHTISVPRIEPAAGSTLAAQPLNPVSDQDFRKIVAILRLAVPYTGIIMSTRENAETRREGLALGVSQISAGSRTHPGGYAELGDGEQEAQFQLGDHRPLDQVVRDVASLGYIPSFCTACYRLGRTGADFMDLAKPGLIKQHCGPNALSSFAEYLADYATPDTRNAGEALTATALTEMDDATRDVSRRLLDAIQADQRDVFV